MQQPKLVCFDLDGTLLLNTNSVAFLCELNGHTKELDAIEHQEDTGTITWRDADIIKATLMKGLHTHTIEPAADHHFKFIDGITNVITTLHTHHIQTILLTTGPLQIATYVQHKFGFDAAYGSIYDEHHGTLTGTIINHLDDTGKLRTLTTHCTHHHITLHDCIAVGDSLSDLEIFNHVAKAIAINPSPAIQGKHYTYITTHNLTDILPHILPQHQP